MHHHRTTGSTAGRGLRARARWQGQNAFTTRARPMSVVRSPMQYRRRHHHRSRQTAGATPHARSRSQMSPLSMTTGVPQVMCTTSGRARTPASATEAHRRLLCRHRTSMPSHRTRPTSSAHPPWTLSVAARAVVAWRYYITRARMATSPLHSRPQPSSSSSSSSSTVRWNGAPLTSSIRTTALSAHGFRRVRSAIRIRRSITSPGRRLGLIPTGAW